MTKFTVTFEIEGNNMVQAEDHLINFMFQNALVACSRNQLDLFSPDADPVVTKN